MKDIVDIYRVEWEFIALKHPSILAGSYQIITKEEGYENSDYSGKGVLHKKAKKHKCSIVTTYSLDLAQEICDSHNLRIAENKEEYLRREINVMFEAVKEKLVTRFT